MRRLLAAIVTLSALAAITGPVYAQMQMGKREGEQTPLQAEDAQKKKAAEKAEKEYQATMRKNQGPGSDRTVVDPWANMRAVDGSQPKQ